MESEAEKAFNLHTDNGRKWAKCFKKRREKHNNQKEKKTQNKRNMEAWVAAKLLTGTSHGWRVFVCSEVLILTPAVH